MAAVIRKGPWRLGASFAVGCVVLRFLASNQTLSPTPYGVNLDGVERVCALRRASAASLRALWMVSKRVFRGGDEVSLFVW